jgi:hypothetical protein
MILLVVNTINFFQAFNCCLRLVKVITLATIAWAGEWLGHSTGMNRIVGRSHSSQRTLPAFVKWILTFLCTASWFFPRREVSATRALWFYLILHIAVMGKNPFSLFLFSSLVCCRTCKNGRDMCQSLNSGLGVAHKYMSEKVQSWWAAQVSRPLNLSVEIILPVCLAWFGSS